MRKNDISWNIHQTVKGNHKLLLDEDMGMKDMTEKSYNFVVGEGISASEGIEGNEKGKVIVTISRRNNKIEM